MKKYAYEDITKLVDDGKTLTIYSKEGVIAQLSSLEFEVADLAELVEECTDHKILMKILKVQRKHLVVCLLYQLLNQ